MISIIVFCDWLYCIVVQIQRANASAQNVDTITDSSSNFFNSYDITSSKHIKLPSLLFADVLLLLFDNDVVVDDDDDDNDKPDVSISNGANTHANVAVVLCTSRNLSLTACFNILIALYIAFYSIAPYNHALLLVAVSLLWVLKRLSKYAFLHAIAVEQTVRTDDIQYDGSPIPPECNAFKHIVNTSKLHGANCCDNVIADDCNANCECNVKLLFL